MSVSATAWAWGVKGISGTQKLVLLALADRAGENYECWPSMGRLTSDTGLTKTTIRKAISDMCILGLVRKEERHKGGRQTSNSYALLVRGCEIVPHEGCESARGEGCDIGIQNLPEEPLFSISNMSGSDVLTLEQQILSIPPDVSPDKWEEFIRLRKRKRAEPTVRSILSLFKALNECVANGIEKDKMLDMCLDNGWKGVNYQWVTNKQQKLSGGGRRQNKPSFNEMNYGEAGDL